MVPADCDLCKRHLMIWDVKTFWCRQPKGIGEIQICHDCLPKDRIQTDETVELDFVSEERKRARSLATRAKVKTKHDPGFTGPELGSEVRFDKRKREVPWLRHTFWWFVHNCVSHPLIGVLPFTPLFKFHDWTSVRMHAKKV